MSGLRGAGDDFRPLLALGEPPLRYRMFAIFNFSLAEYADHPTQCAVKSLP